MLQRPPRYREHRPSAPMAEYVACYWTLRGEVAPGGETKHLVLPDGCMDVILDLAEAGGEARPGPPSYVVGTMTRPVPVRRAGAVDLLGVRFRPGGITPFVPVPALELTDGIASLGDVWGGRAREIRERVQELSATSARIALVDRVLAERLRHGEAGEGDATVRAAARLAERHGGLIRVAALAEAMGLGRRQLERRFLAVVGVSPKTVCRVLRFQGTITRLAARPTASLGRIALEAGYHDQAHFTREFGALAGVSPGAYRKRLVTAPSA